LLCLALKALYCNKIAVLQKRCFAMKINKRNRNHLKLIRNVDFFVDFLLREKWPSLWLGQIFKAIYNNVIISLNLQKASLKPAIF